MKLVYIVGPYRGVTAMDVERNIRRAEEAAYKVAAVGAFPVCAHSMIRPYLGSARKEEFWLEGDLELMKRCDAILLMSGWEDSEGSREEHKIAEQARLQIFYDEQYGQLLAWAQEKHPRIWPTPPANWRVHWMDPMTSLTGEGDVYAETAEEALLEFQQILDHGEKVRLKWWADHIPTGTLHRGPGSPEFDSDASEAQVSICPRCGLPPDIESEEESDAGIRTSRPGGGPDEDDGSGGRRGPERSRR